MVLHYLKSSIKRAQKNLAFSIVNIIGLAIGITSFYILFIYVVNEKNFDKHFTDYENIYRVISGPVDIDVEWARSLGFIKGESVNIPEVEECTQFTHCPLGIININEKSYRQEDIMSVDESFVHIFELESLVGDLSEISEPNTAFISEDFAEKYFGDENPIGKTIEIEALQYLRDVGQFQIRGIVKNTKPKTHFNYHILLSQKGALQERFASLPNRKVHWVYNYFKLKKGASPAPVADKLLSIYNKSNLKQVRGPQDYKFSLIPLKDIHLKSDYRFELKESSSKVNIGLFTVISFVILLVSLMNFINLNIAKLIKRSKELGVIKVSGANNRQVTQQILVETLLLSSLSIVISLVIIQLLKPGIIQFFEIDFDIYYTESLIYICIVGVSAIVGALTVLFVGFFLSGRNSTFSNLSEKNSYASNFVLKRLLIFQITIVIVLISSTIAVNKQINFITNKSLGFNEENVVVIQNKDFSKDPAVFVNELKKQNIIVSVGSTSQHFGYPTQNFGLEGLGLEGNAEFVLANYDYVKAMGIELLHNWISASADTIEGMLINEHLYKRLLQKHGSLEAIESYSAVHNLDQNDEQVKIIGVAKDFNYNSAHEPVGDFAFLLGESPYRSRFIHARIKADETKTAIATIEKIWKAHYPNQEFIYFFINEKIAQQYKSETILLRILFVFSVIGIFISIIGISALSLFISQQRTKEIGIRKVNGAKVSEIIIMLNKDFVKWVLVAFVMASPIAYYIMKQWLENFAYKTELSWWIFALAGLSALVITLITVSLQSWRAATRNPVEALRYE